MKAIVTVSGKDKTGIIAKVSSKLSDHGVNILDISQTVLQDYFAMIMLVDLTLCEEPFLTISESLEKEGRKMGMDVRMMKEEIFDAMHRI